MKEYAILRKSEPFEWSQIPALAIDCLLWSAPTTIAATAQLCYDESAIFVRLSAVEQEIRAVHNSPLGMPCEDSCLEFFFCPAVGDDRYFNIEFNPNCCMYLGFGRDRDSSVRLLPERSLFEPKAERTADGWRVTYRVPFSFICNFFPTFTAVPGGTIRANCYKCGDLTRTEHYLSWNPVLSATPCFHRPCDFGLMRFA